MPSAALFVAGEGDFDRTIFETSGFKRHSGVESDDDAAFHIKAAQSSTIDSLWALI
jgi:hypothetical protein